MSRRVSESDFDEVLNEYEYAALASTTEERNKAFRKADAADMPVMWIDARRKYADVEVDFITTPSECRGLNEADYKQAQRLNDYYLGRTLRRCKKSHRSQVLGFRGDGGWSVFQMNGLLIDDAVEYADKLAELVFDKENWEMKKVGWETAKKTD